MKTETAQRETKNGPLGAKDLVHYHSHVRDRNKMFVFLHEQFPCRHVSPEEMRSKANNLPEREVVSLLGALERGFYQFSGKERLGDSIEPSKFYLRRSLKSDCKAKTRRAELSFSLINFNCKFHEVLDNGHTTKKQLTNRYEQQYFNCQTIKYRQATEVHESVKRNCDTCLW